MKITDYIQYIMGIIGGFVGCGCTHGHFSFFCFKVCGSDGVYQCSIYLLYALYSTASL